MPAYGSGQNPGSSGPVAAADRSRSAVDHRKHERYGMRFPVTVVFEDGTTLHGHSEDVSLTGFFVVCPGVMVAVDRHGQGTIQLGQDRHTFHCRVARQTPAGLALSITKDCAILGYAITNHLFNQLSSVRLGPGESGPARSFR
ncbi:MAG: PilZ domain-containing protein [Magnetococcales bacterium]|nr:PilZ domain-containing protein [Magnetococcales bacterium]